MKDKAEIKSRAWDNDAKKELFGMYYGQAIERRTKMKTTKKGVLGVILKFEFELAPGADIGIEGFCPFKDNLDIPDDTTKDIIRSSAEALVWATSKILLDYGQLQKSFWSRLKFLFTGGVKTIDDINERDENKR